MKNGIPINWQLSRQRVSPLVVTQPERLKDAKDLQLEVLYHHHQSRHPSTLIQPVNNETFCSVIMQCSGQNLMPFLWSVRCSVFIAYCETLQCTEFLQLKTQTWWSQGRIGQSTAFLRISVHFTFYAFSPFSVVHLFCSGPIKSILKCIVLQCAMRIAGHCTAQCAVEVVKLSLKTDCEESSSR